MKSTEQFSKIKGDGSETICKFYKKLSPLNLFKMYKKSKKSIGEKLCFSEKIVSNPEKTLLDLIGHENLPKWHNIKIQLSCETDEEFIIKLLEIAQEFLYRYFFMNSHI